MKLQDIKRTLRNGKFAWPGGYPLYFITSDGAVLSFEAVRKRWRDVCEAHIIPACHNSGWRIVACEVNWENPALYCDETGKRIESAYSEVTDRQHQH